MAKEGKTGQKRKRKNRNQVDDYVSDDSDEDYKIDEDEVLVESDDDDAFLLAEDESQDSWGEFEDEGIDDEFIEERGKNVRMPRGRFEEEDDDVEFFEERAKNVRMPRGRFEEDEDNDEFFEEGNKDVKMPRRRFEEDEDDEFFEEEKKNVKMPRRRYEEDEDDEFFEERNKNDKMPRRRFEEGEDDDEFLEERAKNVRMPRRFEEDEDDDEFFEERNENVRMLRGRFEEEDDDDEFINERAKNVRMPRRRFELDEDNDEFFEERNENVRMLRGRFDDDDEFIEERANIRKNRYRKRTGKTKKNVNLNGRRRDSNASSDSDFDDDDEDYMISEEENEFLKKGNEICESSTAALRSSALLETIKEDESPLKRDHGRKGKQKVVNDMNVQVGKQVCGICLSEEGKRKAVGVLSCCTHYFCFTCIMEWSKIESRCPLCKQRFVTIRRTMRSDAIHDVRDTLFHVPERYQVYQPSEEELRGYLDPYANALCNECHQGVDDALMLHCDLCDSSTHTYCANLGNEIPEGNWYCSDCRPTFLASENDAANNIHFTPPSSQPADPIPEPLDLNNEYVPDTPPIPSPRSSFQIRAVPPTSASTLLHRRRFRLQILEDMNYINGDGEFNLLGPLIASRSTSSNRGGVISSSLFRGQSSNTSSSHGVAASGLHL